jgi:hypothetical protein
MSKLMIALTAVIVTTASSAAMAQFKDSRFGSSFPVYGGHGTNFDTNFTGPPPGATERNNRPRRQATAPAKRRPAAPLATVAKEAEVVPPQQSAEVKSPPGPAVATETPPASDLTTGSTGATATPATAKTISGQGDCKQYFAQVGMTLSVPCAK